MYMLGKFISEVWNYSKVLNPDGQVMFPKRFPRLEIQSGSTIIEKLYLGFSRQLKNHHTAKKTYAPLVFNPPL